MERKVLGKGLEALIPTENKPTERVQLLRLSQVHASRFQPRLNFPESKIQELAKSIKEKGVIQPIIVRALDNDNFELIAGERRLRALKYLGLAEVPAIVRRVPDADVLEMSLIENIQRQELNAIEEGKAYRRLMQEFGLNQELIAERVGKDKSSVSNTLRILNLPEKIQDYLSKEFITFGHAKALLSLGDAKRQLSFCEKIIKKGLSVRQAEFLTTSKSHPKSRRVSLGPSADIKNLEEKLQHALGTKVRIHHGKKRGRVEIEYYSFDDLDRLLKILGVS